MSSVISSFYTYRKSEKRAYPTVVLFLSLSVDGNSMQERFSSANVDEIRTTLETLTVLTSWKSQVTAWKHPLT